MLYANYELFSHSKIHFVSKTVISSLPENVKQPFLLLLNTFVYAKLGIRLPMHNNI